MTRFDYGRRETDKQLAELEKRIAHEYRQAGKEVERKANDYFARFKERDEKMVKRLERGEITRKEYNAWRQSAMLEGERWKAVRDSLAQDYVNADKIAMNIVGDSMLDTYAFNMNFGTYSIEHHTRLDTSFTLYDAGTVKRLLKDKADLLPRPRVDIPKDRRWNQQKVQSALTQGILQGDSVQNIAKRLQSVTDMDKNAAIRNARTMTTNAENAGRLDSYRRAQGMGIEVKKMWVSTLDNVTRDSHVDLDGEVQDIDRPFSNGLDHPGGAGEPAEVYNCRCCMVAEFPKYSKYDYERSDLTHRDNKLGDMSYEEWKESHKKKEKQEAALDETVINAKDISATWARRADKFAFEIEDVLNAQGFDGLPRVVSKEEFDAAVKAANDGKGFIAQRTYSAPDQEMLDAYREQLYNGKWYVDCSTGGAQYGQGMYCAADYTGKLTDGIKSEMEHYIELNRTRTVGAAYNNAVSDMYKNIDAINANIYMENVKPITKEQGEVLSKLYGDSNMTIYKLSEKDKAIYDSIGESQRLSIRFAVEDIVGDSSDFAKNFKGYSYTETMTLDPSAKIIGYDDLFQMKSSWVEEKKERFKEGAIRDILKGTEFNGDENAVTFLKFQTQTGNVSFDDAAKANAALGSKADKVNELRTMVQEKQQKFEMGEVGNAENIGSFAAMLGYDAIDASGHGASGSYTVVLNRTKLIILDER